MWTAIAVLLFAIEIITTNLVTIWIATGATIAAFCALGGINPVLQWLIFIVISVVLLIATKPLLEKYVKKIFY